jgi:DNA transformation protein
MPSPTSPTSAQAAAAELARLRNLGPVSAAWLVAAGILSAAELRRLGAVAAYHRVATHRSGDASLNLLYALEGALRGVRWDRIPAADRAALRAAVDAPAT